jgi:cellobiose phosphorylase
MGTGDWNDGMNKVGAQGKGESVWKGWFFITVLNSFAKLAERLGQTVHVNWCQQSSVSAWKGNTLRFEPCVPPSWSGFEMIYRHRRTTYQIWVDNSAGTGRGVRAIELDGQRLPNGMLPLLDHRKTHKVVVQLG